MEKELLRAYRTYEGFFAIDRGSFQEKIRYYKRHMQEISFLPFQERITIDYYYIIAYFEVGAYSEFLLRVDRLIETTIDNNIYKIEELDPYKELLFKKSASLFNHGEYENAIHILKQLHRMYPSEKKIKHLLHHSYKRKFSSETINFKACCVLLYFTAGAAIAIKIFLVENFYPQFSATMDNIWLSLFLIASILIIGNEALVYLKSKKAQ